MVNIGSGDNLVSVIVPVYNTSKYLPKCLESLVNQRYTKIEIIVINDGSTDHSEEIIKQYAENDDRIRWYTTKNNGLSAARNYGLSKATGDLICFLDSDDWIDENTFFDIIPYFGNDVNLEVAMWAYKREYNTRSIPVKYYGDSVIHWTKENSRDLFCRLIGPIEHLEQPPQMIDSASTAWGKLYRRNVIKSNQFVDEKIVGSEDLLFNVAVFARVKNCLYLPTPYSHYRKDNQISLTRNYSSSKVDKYLTLFSMIKKIIDTENDCDKLSNALKLRVLYSFIGLSLNISEDEKLSLQSKRNYILEILNKAEYLEAIGCSHIAKLPIQWRFYFTLVKKNRIYSLLGLLKIMNHLRKLA